MVDITNASCRCFYIKIASLPAHNFAKVCACFLSLGNYCFYHVAGLEAKELFLARQVPSWKAKFVDIGAAVLSTACGCYDLDSFRPKVKFFRRGFSYTTSVQTVVFGNVTLQAVVMSQSASSTFNRKTKGF